MSKVGKDGDDDGKEEEEDMGCVFFGVKQENLHAPGVVAEVASFSIDVVRGGEQSEAEN